MIEVIKTLVTFIDIPLHWLLNMDNHIHRQLHSTHKYVATTFLFLNAKGYEVSA